MPSPFVTELEAARTSQVAFGPVERGGPTGSLVAEIVHALARTDLNAWRFDFADGSIDQTEDWQAPTVGSGMTTDASTGQLVIATGTTTNSETILRSKRSFRLPLRALVAVILSQRIANQEFYIELTNAAGTVFARYKLDGTTATTGKWEAQTGPLAATSALGNSVTISTTASSSVFEIEIGLDETNFRQRSVTSGFANERASRMDMVPRADEDLYLQIRAKNLGTAPASSTSFTVMWGMVQDVNELAVEIAGGRGTSAQGQAILIQHSALTTSNSRIGSVGAGSQWIDTSTTALAGAATFTGTGRDLFGVATATATQSGAYTKEYRAVAVADQAGTLHLEISRDNVTWRRIRSVATSLQGGNQVAELNYAPVSRYARVVYINGATLQGFFHLGEALLAA